ncbi:MAG: 2-oxoglutarate dehydrogenase complex dihydrolipoyllysine-residue succinyltransferase [Phycisphaerales bacterium]|nr:2-oxoglutarate dehydrogenase complex dihydrolipoyllysine-residue succinyltransferase [Phycisphaerales bacterium]
MPIDIVIPQAGESVTSGVISRWLKNAGDFVKRDEGVLEIETDKVTMEVPAPAAGVLRQNAKAGETVNIGAVVGSIDESASAPASAPAPSKPAAPAAPAAAAPVAAAPVAASTSNGHHASAAAASADVRATPLARKLAEENRVDLSRLTGTGPSGRIREQDVLAAIATPAAPAAAAPAAPRSAGPALASTSQPATGSRREKMSPLRQRIAQRLVEAQHAAAMLTTFNEVDMGNVMALRTKYKEEFEKKHGVGLGFMSFFVKAAANALKQFPIVNAYLVKSPSGEQEVEFHESADIAVAVSTPKGLTVPVLRGCERLSFSQIELGIKDLATRAREGKLTLDQLQGGTFTITNGGIFGSMMSTPILNSPQSAILGMHAIKNRPVEHPDKPGEIALRPMMYLALSYDHRLLDGSDAVQFLVAIKSALERPERLLIGL